MVEVTTNGIGDATAAHHAHHINIKNILNSVMYLLLFCFYKSNTALINYEKMKRLTHYFITLIKSSTRHSVSVVRLSM